MLKVEYASTTAVNSFFWNVDLAAGMEMEKTINFSIIPEIKNKKKTSDKAAEKSNDKSVDK